MIEIKNVTKGYGKNVVIDNFNLTVENSSVLGLIGFNGCGKTTLLNVCAGVFKAENGAVHLDGKDVFDNVKEKTELFYVSDNMLFPTGATIQSAARFYGQYYTQIDKKLLSELCELFNLNMKKPIKGFSKGMLKQTTLAIALACKPKYLLIDEAFDGLDPHIKDVVRKLLLEYINNTDCSVIISSHNLSEIYNLCDRVAMIKGSKIVLDSSIDDVSSNFRRFTLKFNETVSEDLFKEINYKSIKIFGNTVTICVFGDIAEETTKIHKLNPVSIDSQLLTLEEIFTLESEVQEENEKIKKLFK